MKRYAALLLLALCACTPQMLSDASQHTVGNTICRMVAPHSDFDPHGDYIDAAASYNEGVAYTAMPGGYGRWTAIRPNGVTYTFGYSNAEDDQIWNHKKCLPARSPGYTTAPMHS